MSQSCSYISSFDFVAHSDINRRFAYGIYMSNSQCEIDTTFEIVGLYLIRESTIIAEPWSPSAGFVLQV